MTRTPSRPNANPIQPVAVFSSEGVESLIREGRHTEAVDAARKRYKQASDDVNQRLLERALFGQVQALHGAGRRNPAREVAKDLLKLDISHPDVLAGISVLLAPLGLQERAAELQVKLNSPDVQALMIPRAADQAVLHPDQPGLPAALQEGAYLVRAALADMDAGQETQAQERLRDVPRNSPFADWRLFVRGLTALRRGETEQVRANWERLDPERAAAKIARQLQPRPSSAGNGPDLSPIERIVFGEPVLAKLAQISAAMNESELPSVVKLIGPVRSVLRRIDPRLSLRLTECLLESVVNEAFECDFLEARRWVEKFSKEVDPLPFDPHWRRLWGLMFERVEGEIEETVRRWELYASEVDSLTCWNSEQRRRVKALVFARLAEELNRLTDPRESGPFGELPGKKQIERFCNRAAQFAERSQREDPTYRRGYELLLEFRQRWKEDALAHQAAVAYSAAFPDAVEPLLCSARYLANSGKALEAIPLAERARELKPLDRAVQIVLAFVVGVAARQYAGKGKFSESREAFVRCMELVGPEFPRWRSLAQRAALEFKAGETSLAEALLEQALAAAPAPAALWLQMSVEGDRWKLPPALKRAHDAAFAKSLAAKVSGAAAGAMANTVLSLAANDVKYAGRSRHERDLVAYLKRATRVQWRLEDLVDVCMFMLRREKPQERQIFKAIAERGVRKFRERAEILWFDARARLSDEYGFAQAAGVARQLKRALELIDSGQTSAVIGLKDCIKRDLTLATQLSQGPLGMGGLPGAGGGFFDMFRELLGGRLNLHDLADLDDDDFDDDDDDWEQGKLFETGPSPDAPNSKPARKPSKRKKR